MKRLALLFAISAAACGDDGIDIDADLVRLDEASEEVFVVLEDMVDRDEVETDDAMAARMLEPADGAQLSAAQAPTLTWDHAPSTARHGRITGDFVWLRIGCPNLEKPVDVFAIETEEWTIDDEHWSKITEAALASDSAQCTVSVVSAYIDDAIVTEGPYRPSTSPSYLITE
jgi:hypothetical protein